MDPATALSVTCNGLQLFDVAVRLLSGAQDIYKSSDGATFNTVVIEAIADNVTKLNTSLKAQEELVPSLKQLTQLSSAVAGDLSDILRNLKTRSPHNKWQSFKIALKEMWTKNQIEQFSNRLQQLQAQITANIQFLIKWVALPQMPYRTTRTTMTLQALTIDSLGMSSHKFTMKFAFSLRHLKN